MSRTLRIAGLQRNLVVGALDANTAQLADGITWAHQQGCDLVVTPELAISSYPPEDLLHVTDFVASCQEHARALLERAPIDVLVGTPLPTNSGTDLDAGRRIATNSVLAGHGDRSERYDKVLLPTYGVFDEARVFRTGREAGTYEVHTSRGSVRVGICICEDLWDDRVPAALANKGADCLVVLNASPYEHAKTSARYDAARRAARRHQLPVMYLNLVGGQDEIVFDGASFTVDSDGTLTEAAPRFAAVDFAVELDVDAGRFTMGASRQLDAGPLVGVTDVDVADTPAQTGELYRAIVLGLRDYVHKNGFKQVAIGLSGGIDSAVVAALAVDALGTDHVWGISMPGPYSSGHSVDDARELATRFGIRFDVVGIKGGYNAMLDALESDGAPLAGRAFDVTEENLQARLRGMTLMAIVNKTGGIVLATGNKSEMSVGYSTLYGDLCGGFAPIKDAAKGEVYAMARWRNAWAEAHGETAPIPSSTIVKPPSAELAPGQRDDDSLPPYDLLDAVLEAYIEQRASRGDLVAQGFEPALVERICAMVDNAEYKRRQSPPGIKLTPVAFGRDRRLPITNHWRPARMRL